jgi:hypothetical protein
MSWCVSVKCLLPAVAYMMALGGDGGCVSGGGSICGKNQFKHVLQIMFKARFAFI